LGITMLRLLATVRKSSVSLEASTA
jgi:hypothetical protein